MTSSSSQMIKTILVLPSSYWQIPLINKIRSLGHRVVTINPYEDSPGFKYSDEYKLADVLNKEKCLSYAKEWGIHAVLSDQSDISMVTVAYIANRLHLPALTQAAASLYTNKLLMCNFCKEHNLPHPEYTICYSIDEVISFYHKIGKKIIIKPLDSNSSRGVFTINSLDEIDKKFTECLSFSKVEKAVLAQRYINGVEFTVDGIKTPEKHYSLVISEKKHYPYNENIASQLVFSHSNDTYDYELLRNVNDEFVNLSGLSFGLTHAEYKYEDGKYYLIEIAARGGGNLISSDIVPLMTGIDNYAYLINCSLGNFDGEIFSISNEYKSRWVVLQFLDILNAEGVVTRIEGLDYLSNCDRVIAYKLNFKIGDVIHRAENDAARIGFYIAYGDTKDQLDTVKYNIDLKLKIIIEDANETKNN